MFLSRKFLLGIALVAVVVTSGHVIAAKPESEKLKIFSQVLSYVRNNYVEEVDEDKLIEGAIKGMLAELDAHFAWLSPKQYKEMMSETKGEFGGIGIEITMKDRILTIVAPIEDTPAYKAGLAAGDVIVK